MSFDNVRGAEQWAAELKALIDQSRQANDSAARRKLSERLTDFIVASFPLNDDEREAINRLDGMAAEVSENLLIEDAQQRLKAIASRANDLARFQKTLAGEASRNVSAARSIRLENLQAAIAVATDVVASLTKVRDDLDESNEGERNTKTKIDRAIKSVQDARNLIENLSLG